MFGEKLWERQLRCAGERHAALTRSRLWFRANSPRKLHRWRSIDWHRWKRLLVYVWFYDYASNIQSTEKSAIFCPCFHALLWGNHCTVKKYIIRVLLCCISNDQNRSFWHLADEYPRFPVILMTAWRDGDWGFAQCSNLLILNNNWLLGEFALPLISCSSLPLGRH